MERRRNTGMATIEINNFVKRYGAIEAVKGINLSIDKGGLFGLIGPDGAGKTTLMRSVCTLLLPDEGSIYVNGFDTKKDTLKIRSILGYMPQRFSLYQDLTVTQNLRFFADLFQVPPDEQKNRLAELYQFSRLEPFKTRLAGALSGGMKQKLALSCALIHTPEILVLDEPTFGVDPVSRDEFWDILYTIRDKGTTILVSTAYMDEADLCDRVALFFDGKIKTNDTPNNLKTKYKFPLFRIFANDLNSMINLFNSVKDVHTIQKFGDSLHISFLDNPDQTKWKELKNKANGNLLAWEQIEPSIEDIFLDMMESDDE
jgi:ABC-2 type transport system ATP-binding protein